MKTDVKKEVLTLYSLKHREIANDIRIVGNDEIRQKYCNWWNDDYVSVPSEEIQEFIRDNIGYVYTYNMKRSVVGKEILCEYLETWERSFGYMETINTLRHLSRRRGLDLNYMLQLKHSIIRHCMSYIKDLPDIVVIGDRHFINMSKPGVSDKQFTTIVNCIRAHGTDKGIIIREYEKRISKLQEKPNIRTIRDFARWYTTKYLIKYRTSMKALYRETTLSKEEVNRMFDIMSDWFPKKLHGDVILLFVDFSDVDNDFYELEREVFIKNVRGGYDA